MTALRRNGALALMGRRLVRQVSNAAAPAEQPAGAALNADRPCAGAPHQRRAAVAASADAAVIEARLSPAVMTILKLGEAASGGDRTEFLSQAIVREAERIGLPGLLESGEPGVFLSGARVSGRPLAARGSDEAAVFLSNPPAQDDWFHEYPGPGGPGAHLLPRVRAVNLTDDGDLIAVPDFRRTTISRFQGRDCGPPLMRRARGGQPRSGERAVSERNGG